MRCPRCDHAVSKSDRFCGRCGLALPSDGGKPVDPLLGLVVDNRYRIEERIGVGGMGTVYLGTHVNLGQKVAIKVLHERHVANDDLVKRFHVEARTYARVDHPNVVKLMHFDQMPDGTTYMVMEYCPGTSLAAHLHSHGKLDPVMAGDLAVQIAQGLSATHSAGIVHRDL
ncbi:MAG: protein kinase, partial [Myxococcales bacterium]|nr:protein kinase [Myxococcales bacterium]